MLSKRAIQTDLKRQSAFNVMSAAVYLKRIKASTGAICSIIRCIFTVSVLAVVKLHDLF